ncbi:MAG: hypothetical protein U0Q07_09180 [Acidimicrobiales bacterium]
MTTIGSRRARRRAVVLAVLGGLVAAVAGYRRRALGRAAEDFARRYPD